MSEHAEARLRVLFDAAIDQPVDQRRDFLHANFPHDAQLIDEALELAAYADDDADALAEPVAKIARSMTAPRATGVPGSRIGAWHVIEEIGQGGMGTVYRVERRDNDYVQVAALKLIRGFPTRESVARFRRERRLLATLEHPNIARLIDGGTTDEGQPYLVMSFVEGKSLGEWARAERPSPQRCARLVQALCLAVHHAHQHLIVHRDLKPGNVLVGADDSPTLVDFGIAKLLAETDERTLTVGQVMTPAYASPEQRAGGIATTASDIFGLGVILSELLGASTTDAASNETTQRMLSGDLANVARMATRAEPQRRYPSAAAMADDIERYFSGRPLVAAPDAIGYRLRKFIGRHRVAVIAACAVVVMSLVFTWQLLEQRDLARQEAAVASEVTTYLRDLFKQADPATAQGLTWTARDLLDMGERQLSDESIADPRVRARLRATVGEIYASIGDPKRSTSNLDEAVRLMREDPDLPPATLAATLHELARSHELAGTFDAGLAAAREALVLRESQFGPDSHEVALTLNVLGVITQGLGRLAEAQPLFERARVILEALPTELQDDLASSLHNLGWLAYHRADHANALPLLRRSLELKQSIHGPDHPRTLNTIQVLAQSHARNGDFAIAQPMFANLLERRRRVNGEQSLPTLRAYNEVAGSLQDVGRYNEALPYYATAMRIARALSDGESIDIATQLNNAATLDEDRGDLARAEDGFRKTLAMRSRLLSSDHPAVARVQHNLARVRLARGDRVEARLLAQAALAVRETKLAAAHPERFDTSVLLARIDIGDARLDGAAARLDSLTDTAKAETTNALRHARWLEARAQLARARSDVAAEIAAIDAQMIALRRLLREDHPYVAVAELARAQASLRAGDADDARRRATLVRQVIEDELSPLAPARGTLAGLTNAVAGQGIPEHP